MESLSARLSKTHITTTTATAPPLLPVVGSKYNLIFRTALPTGQFLLRIVEQNRTMRCHLKNLVYFEGTDLMKKACELVLPNYLKSRDTLVGTCVRYIKDLPVFEVWTATGILIHSKIWEYIMDNAAGCPPIIGDKSVVCTISYLDHKGHIYVHMEGSFIYDLENKIAELRPEELKHGRADVALRGAQLDEIYLAPDTNGSSLYRCVVTKIIPGMGERKVCVRFIDYGNSTVVLEKNLLRAVDIGVHIAYLPPTVLPLHLKGIASIPDPTFVYEKYKGLKFFVQLRSSMRNSKQNATLWTKSPGGKMRSLNKGLLASKLAIAERLS